MDYTWKTYILLSILILIILIIIYKIIQSLNNTETNYNWTYNTYNDNKYILLFIIMILVLIIYNFNYISRKQILTNIQDTTLPTQQKSIFSNVNNIHNNNISYISNTYENSISNHNTNDNTNTIQLEEQNPNVTKVQKELMTNTYQQEVVTNPSNNLFISNEEKNQWRIARSLLDGNEESLSNTNGSPYDSPKGYGRIPKNDILQTNSTLFTNDNNNDNDNKIESANTSSIGVYASLDSLGKGLTDTLGGIHTELGYTVLDEQLGTFKKEEIHNPHTYDETANYNTGMSANTVDGNPNGIINLSSGNFSKCGNGQPVFIQKDFDGVANIFAPNIIIQNPPLTSNGYPDISFHM
jgi:hypothetical protein